MTAPTKEIPMYTNGIKTIVSVMDVPYCPLCGAVIDHRIIHVLNGKECKAGQQQRGK